MAPHLGPGDLRRDQSRLPLRRVISYSSWSGLELEPEDEEVIHGLSQADIIGRAVEAKLHEMWDQFVIVKKWGQTTVSVENVVCP